MLLRPKSISDRFSNTDQTRFKTKNWIHIRAETRINIGILWLKKKHDWRHCGRFWYFFLQSVMATNIIENVTIFHSVFFLI